MKCSWPDKCTRENWEINGFISAYTRLPHGRELEIQTKREKPDYWVIDRKSAERLGIELTSIYIDDRSVPDDHMPEQKGIVPIPYDREKIKQYKARLVSAVHDKVLKAQGYDTSSPLILSVYINEYIAIYLSRDELTELVRANESVFDNMQPFSEAVFWNLPNHDVLSVRPGNESTA